MSSGEPCCFPENGGGWRSQPPTWPCGKPQGWPGPWVKLLISVPVISVWPRSPPLASRVSAGGTAWPPQEVDGHTWETEADCTAHIQRYQQGPDFPTNATCQGAHAKCDAREAGAAVTWQPRGPAGVGGRQAGRAACGSTCSISKEMRGQDPPSALRWPRHHFRTRAHSGCGFAYLPLHTCALQVRQKARASGDWRSRGVTQWGEGLAPSIPADQCVSGVAGGLALKVLLTVQLARGG